MSSVSLSIQSFVQLDGNVLTVNGQSVTLTTVGGGTDDQQLQVVGSNLVLEDGGTVFGNECTDLSGNSLGVILQG